MASSPPPSTSTALAKRTRSTTDTALMAPPAPPPKRIKRPAKVLDEDAYTDALDHIIARDFFPGLLEARAQQEYLDAVDSRDAAWIADAARRLTTAMTPGPRGRRGVSATPAASATPLRAAAETPRGWGGETPAAGRTPAVAEEEDRRSGVEGAEAAERERMRGMSLNAFQARYTSEDNESFNELLDRQNGARAAKYAWMWQGNKIASARQLAWRERERKLLEAAADGGGGGGGNRDRALVRRDPERERDGDARKAMPDYAHSAPRNALMFTPEGIEGERETVAERAQKESAAPPRAIAYGNTRLPVPAAADGDGGVPPSPSLSAVNDAIAGRPRPSASEAAYSGSETPRVNGYAFVDEDEPDEAAVPDGSLLQRLGVTADASPNPFSISKASRREELHHRLVDKTARSKRSGETSGGPNRLAALKGEGAAAKTPVPKFASSPVVTRGNLTPAGKRKGGNLTPAAQRLLQRVGTPRRAEGGNFGAFGGGGGAATPLGRAEREKVRWTPTPKIRRGV
ncbi:hypothetical protein SLS56_008791 [Neofusicoccum ribis]|uniref:Nuclear protein Es2 n=1 Tax=Neofusicoccum ribis TaxID=45134 RepID=A0ABR3SJ38_9PEZI